MWRSFECCGKKIIGKPCEGEPHARFEVAGDGDGKYRAIAWPYQSRVFTAKCSEPQVGTSNGMVEKGLDTGMD